MGAEGATAASYSITARAGIELKVLYELEWSYGRRWPTRELALAEAEDRKAEYLREGGGSSVNVSVSKVEPN